MIGTYRYGTARRAKEGLRIGAARHLPRGARKDDWQRGGYFDVWMPLLAPSARLLSQYRSGKMSFAVFRRRYEREMKLPESGRAIGLLAAVSLSQPISVGCYCEDESHCHRTILQRLLVAEAERRAPGLSCGEMPGAAPRPSISRREK